MCMIFKYKTSKDVQYGDDDRGDSGGPRLKIPSPEELTTMDMWKQRREGILKTLTNCGLDLRCHYSRDRDHIICKIGASPTKLRDTAARMKYKLQLKSEYLNAYAEYRHDFQGTPQLNFTDRRITSHLYKMHGQDQQEAVSDDAIFTQLDKIILVDHIINSKDKDCAGIQVAHLMHKVSKTRGSEDGGWFGRWCGATTDPMTQQNRKLDDLLHEPDITAYFPLHDYAKLKELKPGGLFFPQKDKEGQAFGASYWDWLTMNESHAEKVRDYFGEKITFYFLFLSNYIMWIIPLAIIGIGLQFIDLVARTPDNFTAIPFCVLLSIWAVMLPHFWKRCEAKYAISWGTLDTDEKLEPYRPMHTGEPRLNPVTGQVEPYFSVTERYWRYAFSGGVIMFSGLLTVGCILTVMIIRHMQHTHLAMGYYQMNFYTAVAVEIMNLFLSWVATWLTKKENHRTQTEHDTSQLAKVLCFKFVNSYFALYYIAFFKNNEKLFGQNMVCMRNDCFLDLQGQLGMFTVLRILIQFAWDYIQPKAVELYQIVVVDKQASNLLAFLSGKSGVEMAQLSKPEKQAKYHKFDPFEEFDQVLATHGYSTLFAVSSPWVCAATLGACLIGGWLDMKKLLETKQRPVPLRVKNIEPWDTAFEVYGILAAFTNLFLLIFTSKQLFQLSYAEKLCLFTFLEHWVVLSRIIIVNNIFPALPRTVEALKMKQENMVHRCLENIKVEPVWDFSSFRDTQGEAIEIFEMDYMEESSGMDLQEPALNLTESGASIYNGVMEQASRPETLLGQNCAPHSRTHSRGSPNVSRNRN